MIINSDARAVTMAPALHDGKTVGSGRTKAIGLFSGPVPDFVTNTKTAQRSGGSLAGSDLLANLDPSVVLHGVGIFDDAIPVLSEGTTKVLQLSSVDQDVVGLVDGTPTWFYFRVSDTTTTSANLSGLQAGNAIYYIVGTVGNETSDADLRILGGQVKQSQTYRCTDLVLNFL